SVSLDGKLMDVGAYTTPVGVYEQTRGMDDVIPKIGEFARRVKAHVMGEELPVASLPAAPPTVSPRTDSAATPSDEPVDVLQSQRGTLTSVINPAFILSPDVLAREGFFMSQRYPRKFKGMDIGDVDGDGKNEVVVIDETNIFIYQQQNAELILKHTISGRSYDNFISVDVADINESGIPEIIVTSMVQERLNSFIVEYRDESYDTIASDLRWFLRVIESPQGPLLLGQEIGMNNPFDNPIYEITWENGAYRQGRRMPIPQGLSVYGTTMASLDRGRTERVIALDFLDYLNVYQRTTKHLDKIHVFRGGEELLWRSHEQYGGSDNQIHFRKQAGSAGMDSRISTEDNVYANVRILTYDLKGDGKNEVIIVRNMSAVGRMLQNVKLFTRSEICGFEWDGLGLLESWKTRTIQGYVTDYQFKDLNNDGRKQIVLSLVLPSQQSVIVAYDLALHDSSQD
ncbi:MAG: VCBS repeat-containing protein, partial [Syntrophales bacterium]|nr:VCBS repeat-containing protein [Syntrophales bacterium]